MTLVRLTRWDGQPVYVNPAHVLDLCEASPLKGKNRVQVRFALVRTTGSADGAESYLEGEQFLGSIDEVAARLGAGVSLAMEHEATDVFARDANPDHVIHEQQR